MDEPGDGDGRRLREGTAHDDEAGRICGQVQQPRFEQGGACSFDRILRAPQMGMLKEPVRRRRACEVGLQVAGRTRRVDVPVFTLQRRAVFKCTISVWNTDAPLGTPSCAASASGAGSACCLWTTAWCWCPRATISSCRSLMVSWLDTLCSCAAKVPTPCVRSTRPSACSSRRARLTVMRLTLKAATSSASEGISAPGGQRPLAKPCFRCCLTRA